MITKVTILHTDLRVECGLAADGALSRKDLARLESACARRLTASALSLFLGRDPSEDDLRGEARTPEGKPYFPAFSDFHYSISHSGGLVVCAAWNRPVGIDLQMIPSDPEKALKVAGRFFSVREQNALQKLQAEDPEAMLRLFARFWTARESYIKLTGRGLAEPFDNYYPDLAENRIYTKSGETFCLTACTASDGYCMTLCSHAPLFPDDIVYQPVL